MLRLFKFLLAAVFTLATVVIVGIIWLLVAVDPNEYKPQIEQLAADNDIRLEIGGDIHWRIWPSLAIELTDTRIAIPQQGIDRLDFRNGALIVDTRQLLQRNVVFRGLSIDGAIIEARTLEDAGKIVAAPALANGADNSDTSRPFSMKVEQIKLNDSSIRFQSGDTLYSLEHLSFLIDGFDIGKPFDLSLSAESTTAEGTPVSLAITTALTLSFGDTAKTIEELVHADSDDLAESLVVDFDKTELKGVYNSIQFNQTFAGKYEHAGGVLTLRELITDLGQARIEGQLRAENLNQSAIVSGQFQTNRIDIPSLVKTLASDNDPGIRTAQTSANFDFRNNRLTLSDLNLALDDYRLQGKLSVDTQSPHNLDLLLSGDQISMPKSTPQNAAQSAEMTEPEALFTPLLAPLAALGDGKGHVELHLKHLSADNVNIDDFHLNIFTNQQIVRVSDLSGKLFGGAFKAAARIDLSKPKPTLSFEKNLTDIDVQAALSNLAEFSDLSGRLTLNFSGTATGDSVDAIQSTTSGQGNFTLTQPVVRNLNLEQSLCEATTALSDTRYIADTSVTSTEFTDIAGNLQMQSGKLGFDNIRTSTGNIHLTARGQVDSLSETVAIQTTANIRANRTSETGCSVNKRLVGVDIPVNCKGPLGGEIACRPDSSIIQRLLQSALLDEVAKRLLKGSSKDAANDSSEVPAEDQETATEETAETPAKKSDVEKAVETIELLRDIFKK